MIKTSCLVAMSAWLIVLRLTSVGAQQELRGCYRFRVGEPRA